MSRNQNRNLCMKLVFKPGPEHAAAVVDLASFTRQTGFGRYRYVEYANNNEL